MNGDFSRLLFPGERDAAILMEQGRPLLDADWNAQALLAHEHLRRYVLDEYGEWYHRQIAFEVKSKNVILSADAPSESPPFCDPQPTIYIRGVRVSLTGLSKGPIAVPIRDCDTGDLLYVDAVPFLRTAIEAKQWRDPAIRGSGAPRLEYRLKVGVFKTDGTTAGDIRAAWCKGYVDRQVSVKFDPLACAERAENSLYRIQVHSVAKDKKSAILKWSRDNASLSTCVSCVTNPCSTQKPSQENTKKLNVDWQELDYHAVAEGSYMEIEDAGCGPDVTPPLLGVYTDAEADSLATIKQVTQHEIELEKEIPKPKNSAIVRFWDGTVTILAENNAPTTIDSLFQFAAPEALGLLQSGDYWLVAVRGANHELETQFVARTRYSAVLGTWVDHKFYPQNQAPFATTAAAPAASLETAMAAPRMDLASTPEIELTRPAITGIFEDLPLRHVSSQLQSAAARRWAASAYVSEAAGCTAAELRSRIQRSLDIPATELAAFDEDLEHIVALANSAGQIIAPDVRPASRESIV